jgi:archaetidylinositol phosphate synthase
MADRTSARETRIQASLLAGLEKRCLIWMAQRIPARINSDHLTALGAVAMLLAGICYATGGNSPGALGAAIVLLAVNWFGDSLDGTLARMRRHERPRYGFYLDHVLDALGILFIFGGLAIGRYISPGIAAGFLLAYYLLSIEIALAAHTVGVFRISYWKFGPTELRILLAIGTLQLMRSEMVTLADYNVLLFDLGGAIGIACLAATFIASAVSNARHLYREEPILGCRV